MLKTGRNEYIKHELFKAYLDNDSVLVRGSFKLIFFLSTFDCTFNPLLYHSFCYFQSRELYLKMYVKGSMIFLPGQVSYFLTLIYKAGIGI